MANPFETQDKRGRPRVKVTAEAVASLKAEGLSFRQIGRKLGVGASTAHKVLKNAPYPVHKFLGAMKAIKERGLWGG